MTTQFFSERFGFAKVRDILQVDRLDAETRNRLWNKITKWLPQGSEKANKTRVYIEVHDKLFKKSIASMSANNYGQHRDLEKWFTGSAAWHECYSLIELIRTTLGESRRPQFDSQINSVLEEESSAWRMQSDAFVRIVRDEQLQALDAVLDDGGAAPDAQHHIRRALTMLKPPTSTPADVMREAIHAVEAQVRHMSGRPKATLAEGLKKVRDLRALHPAFEKAIATLYGYTSDEAGVRHALSPSDSDVTIHDALFFVVACSAFVTWLQSHAAVNVRPDEE